MVISVQGVAMCVCVGGVNTESPRVGNTQSLKTQSQVYFYTVHNKSVNSVCFKMKSIKKKNRQRSKDHNTETAGGGTTGSVSAASRVTTFIIM